MAESDDMAADAQTVDDGILARARKFEADHPEEARRLTLDGHLMVDAGDPPGKLCYIATSLDRCWRIKKISLAGDLVTDKDVPALLKLLNTIPTLEFLKIDKVGITDEGFQKLFAEAPHLPVLTQLIVVRDAENNGPLPIDELLKKTSRLQQLNIRGWNGSAAETEALARGVQKLRDLRFFNLDPVDDSDASHPIAGFDALLDATVVHNRNLVSVRFASSPEEIDKLSRAVLESNSPNLYSAQKLDTEADALLENRLKRFVDRLERMDVELQKEEPFPITAKKIRRLFQYEMSWCAYDSLSKLLHIEGKHFDDLESLVLSLPIVPKNSGELEVYFTPVTDREGHSAAPLDNPRLFENPDDARYFLESLPADQSLLSRRTALGSTVLDAVLMHLTASEVVNTLNGKNLHLGKDELLDSKGKPNRVMQLMLDIHQGVALFSRANMASLSFAEGKALFDLVPAYQRRGFGVAQLRASQTLPQGRTR